MTSRIYSRRGRFSSLGTDTEGNNRPLSNYALVPANNNLKLRLRAKFSYIRCIFSHIASTSGCCSQELRRNFKVVYCFSINPAIEYHIRK